MFQKFLCYRIEVKNLIIFKQNLWNISLTWYIISLILTWKPQNYNNQKTCFFWEKVIINRPFLIRLDRLSEVKYRPPPGSRPPSTSSPTSFLWTLGPRPFWELWPQKKRRKKQLNLDEFTRFLIEQWAKTHGYPLPKYLVTGETSVGSLWSDGSEVAGSIGGGGGGWGSGPASESIWSKLRW